MEVKNKRIRYVAHSTTEQDVTEQTLGSIEFKEEYLIYTIEYTALVVKDEDDSSLGTVEEKVFNKDYIAKAFIGGICKMKTLTKSPMWKIQVDLSGCEPLYWVFPLDQEDKCDELMDALIAWRFPE